MVSFFKQEEFGILQSYKKSLDRPSGNIVVVSESIGPYGLRTISAQGTETPNFHRKVRKGELLPLQPYLNMTETVFGSRTWENARKSDGDEYYIQEPWIPDHLEYALPVNPDVLVQAAAARAYASGHDTLTFLSELVKVRDMFVKLPVKLIRLLKDSPHRTLRELNRFWLEGRYGWRTLLYDLQDLSRVLGELDQARRQRVSERIGTDVNINLSDTREGTQKSIFSTATYGWYDYSITTTVVGSIRGHVVADFMPARFQMNPYVTAWEVIPFSFVIDWIVSVGTAIEATSLAVLAPKHFASYGEYLTVTTTQEVSGARANTSSGYLNATCIGSGTRVTVLRRRVPRKVPKLPLISLKVDAFKISDLTAIYRELTRRK